MKENIATYIKDLALEPATDQKTIDYTQQKMQFIFPEDYKKFMLKHNGAEGSMGENSYVQLWSLENLIKYNQGYDVEKYVPGLILIGSDGGNEAYAYDSRGKSKPIVSVPFIVMNFDDVVKCADNFTDFLQYLYEQE